MDGFDALAAMMGPHQTASLHLIEGKVVSPMPLTVDVGGYVQETARLVLCEHLAKGHREKVKLTGGTGGFTANALKMVVNLDEDSLHTEQTGMETEEPLLQAGDRVLMLTEDDQTFYLIDKVVAAT